MGGGAGLKIIRLLFLVFSYEKLLTKMQKTKCISLKLTSHFE